MNARAQSLAAERIGRHLAEQDLRVLTKRYGGVLGPVFTVCVGGEYYEIGELTLQQLRMGVSPADLDLLPVDPDEEREEY